MGPPTTTGVPTPSPGTSGGGAVPVINALLKALAGVRIQGGAPKLTPYYFGWLAPKPFGAAQPELWGLKGDWAKGFTYHGYAKSIGQNFLPGGFSTADYNSAQTKAHANMAEQLAQAIPRLPGRVLRYTFQKFLDLQESIFGPDQAEQRYGNFWPGFVSQFPAPRYSLKGGYPGGTVVVYDNLGFFFPASWTHDP